jgi:hypothetical protein
LRDYSSLDNHIRTGDVHVGPHDRSVEAIQPALFLSNWSGHPGASNLRHTLVVAGAQLDGGDGATQLLFVGDVDAPPTPPVPGTRAASANLTSGSLHAHVGLSVTCSGGTQ